MNSGDEDFDPASKEEREIGRAMVEQNTGLGSVLAHLYRGEMDRVTTWRQRLDESTKWTVTVIAGLLAYGFSRNGTHAVLLAAMVVTAIFLAIEARRYRDYDIWRSRVRLIQENLFANALDPSQGIEHEQWRKFLSEDFRTPAFKLPYREALARRLRRVYYPLFLLLLVSWTFRVTGFASDTSWVENASLGTISGVAVTVGVALFYAGLTILTFAPQKLRTRKEFESEPDQWQG